MDLKIPQALKVEHEELHSELAQATRAGGKIGEAAKAVAQLLHPHFVKEEEYALPPLGLLSVIAEGQVPSDTERILQMTGRLKSELARCSKNTRRSLALSRISPPQQRKKNGRSTCTLPKN